MHYAAQAMFGLQNTIANNYVASNIFTFILWKQATRNWEIILFQSQSNVNDQCALGSV